MARISKPYQISWDNAKDIEEINRKLSLQLNRIDDSLVKLYNNVAQAQDGEWTPIDQSGAGLVFANRVGHYFKIGSIVVATAYVLFPTTADASTSMLGGLPFTQNLPDNIKFGGFILSTSEATAASMLISTVGLIQPITTAGAVITNATLSTDSLYFTAIYRTAE